MSQAGRGTAQKRDGTLQNTSPWLKDEDEIKKKGDTCIKHRTRKRERERGKGREKGQNERKEEGRKNKMKENERQIERKETMDKTDEGWGREGKEKEEEKKRQNKEEEERKG